MTSSAPITTGIVSVSIFHILSISVSKTLYLESFSTTLNDVFLSDGSAIIIIIIIIIIVTVTVISPYQPREKNFRLKIKSPPQSLFDFVVPLWCLYYTSPHYSNQYNILKARGVLYKQEILTFCSSFSVHMTVNWVMNLVATCVIIRAVSGRWTMDTLAVFPWLCTWAIVAFLKISGQESLTLFSLWAGYGIWPLESV